MTKRRLIVAGIVLFFLAVYVNRLRLVSKMSEIRLGKNFVLSEFVKTATGYDNVPGPSEIENLRNLVQKVLQPLRDSLGKPVIINSGYRSPLVNEAVGGVSGSQHTTGEAADIIVPGLTNVQIIDRILALNLPFDQLIDEDLRGSQWVHVSYSSSSNRKKVLYARYSPTENRVRYYSYT